MDEKVVILKTANDQEKLCSNKLIRKKVEVKVDLSFKHLLLHNSSVVPMLPPYFGPPEMHVFS